MVTHHLWVAALVVSPISAINGNDLLFCGKSLIPVNVLLLHDELVC